MLHAKHCSRFEAEASAHIAIFLTPNLIENAKRAGLFIRDAAISAGAVLRAAGEVCMSRADGWQEPMRKPGGSSPESMVLLCR